MGRALVYLLFFLSGATALVYEVAWTRRLVLVLGSTALVVSLILAAWMLGLALGALVFGRLADRLRNPLFAYGALEAMLGVTAFLFPVLLITAEVLAGGVRVLTALFTFGVLLLPTTLMGGTLPLLCRHVVGRLSGMGGRVGLLYGLNTAGAVVGTFLAGFVLIQHFGVYTSTFLAGLVNLIIGLAAGMLSFRRPGVPQERAGQPEFVPAARIALLAAFLSGFLSLGSEVLWTRMLTFFLEGFTYTFSAMLLTWLLGLALGAMISGRVVDRIRDLRGWIGTLFLGGALLSAAVLFVLTRHFEVTRWAKDLMSGLFTDWQVQYKASLLLAAFVVLFPPALVMGGVFPAAARLATRTRGEVGARVGAVYTVNTLGAVAGALVAGLLVMRLTGMAKGAAALAFVGGAAGLLLLGPRRAPWALPFAAATVGLVLLARPGVPFVLHSHVFRGERALERDLVSYEEGAFAAVSVVEDERNGVRAIYTDDFQAAATGPQYKYMRLLAHLPLLLSPRWEGADVLVICFGTGTTAGSAACHPLGRLDVVEISPEVLAVADRFRDVNGGVLDDDPARGFPVEVHVEDGRNFLLRSRRTAWDVITLEPLMPYTPGAVNLYTKDFYALCRDRLREDGVMCQWIPIHSMSSDDYLMLLRTFTEVFPESSLWFVEGTSLIIGSPRPLAIRLAEVVKRLARERVQADLAPVGFDDPLQVLNAFVSGGAALREHVKDALVMTDERPYIEFHPIPYGFVNSFLAANLGVLHGMREPVASRIDLSAVPEEDLPGLLADLRRFYEGGQEFLRAEHFMAWAGFHDALKERERQRESLLQALEAYQRSASLNPDDASARYLRRNAVYGWTVSLGLRHLADGRLEEAERLFREAASLDNPFKPDLAFTWLGRTLNRMGRYREAEAALDRALAHYPRSPLALAEKGLALLRLEGEARAFQLMRQGFENPAGVPVETDELLLATWKDLKRKSEKGLLEAGASLVDRAPALLDLLRTAPPAEVPLLMERLRRLDSLDPAAVRSALAADLARARDPSATPAEQSFALDVLVDLGDLPGTVELLRHGVPAVREKAADVLGRVKRRESVEALIEAMSDPDRDVREAAWSSVFVLTGRRPAGYDPGGPAEERETALEPLREWWIEAAPHFEPR